jgi:hypothetical protein
MVFSGVGGDHFLKGFLRPRVVISRHSVIPGQQKQQGFSLWIFP